MAFYLSPGVYTKETDLSTLVPRIATTTAGLVGYSKRGTTDTNLITSAQDFVAEYGEPEVGTYFHYTALAYLEQGTQLYCKRVINGALFGGMHVVQSGASGNNVAFDTGQSTAAFYNQSGLSDELFSIVAANQGAWGNSISCIIKNVQGAVSEVTEQYTFEIDVYWTDSDGNSSRVENWKVSRKTKLDGNGKQLYLESRINGYSKYIKVYDNTGLADTVVPKTNATAVSLAGGSDGSVATAAQIAGTASASSGWYALQNPDDVDVRVLLGGGFTSSHSASDIVTIQSAMKTVAEARKDCVAILDVPYSETADVDDTVTFRSTTQAFDSSYCALYSPWVKINDNYNDRVVDVPPSGYVGAQLAYNDYVKYPWFAAAGHNRGKVNSLSLSKVFTEGMRNTIHAQQINPLQVFRGRGVRIWGELTEQSKSSALSSLAVRRTLIIIEKSISVVLQDFVFEPNSELTRFRIEQICTEYLSTLSSQGAFQTEAGDDGFTVVCNTTNNTPAVIDAHELHVDIFVKPSRAAYYIQLQTIITTSGTSFNELVARGALFQ